ncbi:GDP-mannose mannosyl hydrolase [Klebsiella pneumoniae]|uniref:GDP-mannose mannosyl hydrolase n=1 Tax=Klebsiella pneumoniae TaxID=573 RepID=UPI000E2F9AAA|nr:GDP-mannose mannosyl hydrolase [Klebsiella pneumoniae]
MFLDPKEFSFIVKSTPLVSIDLIVHDENGSFLLGQRINRPARGFWFVPGGRILKDETLDSAFKRITLGELGLELDIKTAVFKGVYEHFYSDNFSSDLFSTHYVVLTYIIKVAVGFEPFVNTQHSKYNWFAKESVLSSDDVHANTKAYFI